MSVEKVKRLKSLNDFCNYFDTEDKCRKFLLDVRWNGKPKCPECCSTDIYGPDKERRFRCAVCKKKFSVIQGTIFEKTRVGLPKWFSAIYHMKSENVGPSGIERLCGVSHETAWYMYHRIVEMSQIDFNNFAKLGGVFAEIDETYIGPDKAKQSTKRVRVLKNSVKGGVGNRISFVVVYVRGVGVFGILQPPYATSEQNKKIITLMLERNCTAYCDEGKHFEWMKDYFDEVVQFNHKKRNFVSKDDKTEHSQSVEGFFMHLKRQLRKSPAISIKYIQRYFNEFASTYAVNNFNEKTLVTKKKLTPSEKFLEVFKNLDNLERPITMAELKERDKDQKMIADWQAESCLKRLAKEELKTKRKEKKAAVKIRKETAQAERDRRKKIKEEREEEKTKVKLIFPNGKKRGRKPKPKVETAVGEAIPPIVTQMSLCFDWVELPKTG